MGKLKCNIYAPISEYSYYGDKSRVFIRHLIETRPDLDIHIVEYQSNKDRNGYKDEVLHPFVEAAFPDPEVCFYISHPSLYNDFGSKGNIAFLDSTTIFNEQDARLFIDKCNQLTAVFVASNYAKISLLNLKYMNGEEEVKIKVPVIITTEFSVINELEDSKSTLLGTVPTPKNFLLEGRWDTEDSNVFGGKNKDNIAYIVSNYLNTFKDIDNAPGLIVNVYGDVPGTIDKRNLETHLNDIKKSISYTKSLPKIYLLNGILSPAQTKALYNDPKILALIHAPQRTDTVEMELNFMSTGKPIIFSGFGAQMEILNYDGNVPVNCATKELNVGVEGAGPRLADIYGDYVKYALYEVFYHYDSLKSKATDNSKIFLSTNNRERAIHIFEEAFKYFIPVVKEEEEKPTEEVKVEDVQEIPLVEEVVEKKEEQPIKKTAKKKKEGE